VHGSVRWQAIDWSIQECTVSYEADMQVQTEVEPLSARMRDDSADSRKGRLGIDESISTEPKRRPAGPLGSLPPLAGVGKAGSKSVGSASPNQLGTEPYSRNARESPSASAVSNRTAQPQKNGADRAEVIKRPKVDQFAQELEIAEL
jgi:hypothetical protein